MRGPRRGGWTCAQSENPHCVLERLQITKEVCACACVGVCVFSEHLRGNMRTLHRERMHASRHTGSIVTPSASPDAEYRAVVLFCTPNCTQNTHSSLLAFEPGPFTTSGHKEPNARTAALHVVTFTDFSFNYVKRKKKQASPLTKRVSRHHRVVVVVGALKKSRLFVYNN